MGPREILLAAIVPTGVALVVLLLAHAILRRLAAPMVTEGPNGDGGALALPPRVLPALTVLLLAGGTVLGSYAWQSRVEIWAESVTHRVPTVALVALVVGLLGVLTPARRSAVAAGMLGTLGGGVAAWMILGALHESLISEAARWGWIAGVGLIAGVQSWAIRVGSRAMPGWAGPALVWLLTGIAALGATAGLANAPLVLWPAAGCAFALVVVGLLRRRMDLLAGVSPAIATVFMGVLAMSHWFGDQERWLMFGLLAGAPIGLALAAIPALRSKPIVIRLIPAAVASLGLAGAQAAIAVPALIAATSDSGGGDYYDY
jgi:hypothetical protein